MALQWKRVQQQPDQTSCCVQRRIIPNPSYICAILQLFYS